MKKVNVVGDAKQKPPWIVRVFHDDSVTALKARIVKLSSNVPDISTNDVYLWTKLDLTPSNKKSVIYEFVDNLFHARTFIQLVELETAVLNVFEHKLIAMGLKLPEFVTNALSKHILMQAGISHQLVVLGHERRSRTHQLYDVPVIYDAAIRSDVAGAVTYLDTNANLIPYAHTDTYWYRIRRSGQHHLPYFPFQQQVLRSDDILSADRVLENLINCASSDRAVKVDIRPVWQHFSITDCCDVMNWELDYVFDQVKPTPQVPFIKLLNEDDEAIYKIEKQALLSKHITLRNLAEWTASSNMQRFRKTRMLLVFKCFIRKGNTFVTLIVSPSWTIDLKASQATVDDFEFALQSLQHLLRSRGFHIPVNIVTMRKANMVKRDVAGSIHIRGSKTTTLAQLRNAADVHREFVSYLANSRPSTLSLLWKRVDGFHTQANMHAYMTMLHQKGIPKQTITDMLQHAFNLTGVAAIAASNEWAAAHVSRRVVVSRLPGIFIYITETAEPFKFELRCQGLTSQLQEDTILCFLRHLIHVANKGSGDKLSTGVVMAHPDDQDLERLLDTFDKQQHLSTSPTTNNGSHTVEVDDIQQMKAQMRCPQANKASSSPTLAKRSTKLLQQLQQADSQMFKGEYARSCQAGRQPVPVTELDIKYNQQCFKNAGIADARKVGNTEYSYGCPEIWCPESRVGLTKSQFEKLGRSCPFPGLNETPLDLTQDVYWKGTDSRYLGFVKGNTSLPCCFKRQRQDAEDSNSKRYIMKYQVPAPQGRCCVLPPAVLSNLCEVGDMCFAKLGLGATTQPYLAALGIDWKRFCVFMDSFPMLDFMMLNGGVTCKEFMKTAATADDVLGFRQHISAQQHASYYTKFSLTDLTQAKEHDADYNRELTFYKAYINFVAYSKDESVAKTHHIYNALIPALTGGQACVCFEVDDDHTQAHVGSSTALNTQVRFIVLDHGVYEPIVMLMPDDSDHRRVLNVGEPIIRPIINFIVENSTIRSPGLDALLADLGSSVLKILVGFNLEIHGVITTEHIFVPFHVDTLLDYGYPFEYVNRFLDSWMNTSRVLDASKVLQLLKKHSAFTAKVSDDGTYMVHNSYDAIPLKRMSHQAIARLPVSDDIRVFLKEQHRDKRVAFVEAQVMTQMLYMSYLNHAIKALDMSALAALRHPNNPFPTPIKRKRLHAMLSSLNNNIHISPSPAVSVKHDDLCAVAPACLSPCQWVQGDCKLQLQKHQHDTFIHKAADDLLNPFFNVKHTRFMGAIADTDFVLLKGVNVDVDSILKDLHVSTAPFQLHSEKAYHLPKQGQALTQLPIAAPTGTIPADLQPLLKRDFRVHEDKDCKPSSLIAFLKSVLASEFVTQPDDDYDAILQEHGLDAMVERFARTLHANVFLIGTPKVIGNNDANNKVCRCIKPLWYQSSNKEKFVVFYQSNKPKTWYHPVLMMSKRSGELRFVLYMSELVTDVKRVFEQCAFR